MSLIRALLLVALLLFPAAARAFTILPATVITTAQSVTGGTVYQFTNPDRQQVNIQANLTYGSGGTSVDVYLQTSFDGAVTWIDVCNFHFTTASARKTANLNATTPVTTQVTPTDGSMTANTCQDGLVGPFLRVKWGSSGTYAASTTLQVDVNSGSRITKQIQ